MTDIANMYMRKISNRRSDTINALSSLTLSLEKMDVLCNQLTNYIYIDEPCFLICGSYVRWICLQDTLNMCNNNNNNFGTALLKKGGIYCTINEQNKCVCKNYMHRHIQFDFNKCLVFQKINTQYQQMVDLVCREEN